MEKFTIESDDIPRGKTYSHLGLVNVSSRIEVEIITGRVQVFRDGERLWGYWPNADLTKKGIAEKGCRIEMLPDSSIRVADATDGNSSTRTQGNTNEESRGST
ncbi:hypothetical protein FOQG_18339 [Fusarium oxysporum f. sp. raphani 54005]|uniref:Uncharacterized protein n=1 Tax=Fusarium oxysporum f. sp. raphani 54005 TaxID=1089458 RepID=X0BEL6_FUSOX|nr:hypothetical protein FOQG_18339 [Fusarium oxysporum f. sp. raphani 54005]